MGDISDIDLVRSSSERDGVDALFHRCWPIVWRAAFSVTGERQGADDAAQEAMLRVLRSLKQFDQSRPLDPWLRRIAVNVALDRLRSERRHGVPVGEPVVMDLPERESDAHLLGVVLGLSDDRRVVIGLRFWLGFEPSEIADLLDVPVGTVYSRLGRALEQLREMMEVGQDV